MPTTEFPVGRAPAPLVFWFGGSDDAGGRTPPTEVDAPAWASSVVVVGREVSVVVGPEWTVLFLLFFEARVPPTAPPTMAPMIMIAPINMMILHFP